LPLVNWRTTPSINPSSSSGRSLLGIFMEARAPDP
jgi:hypothetical protein